MPIRKGHSSSSVLPSAGQLPYYTNATCPQSERSQVACPVQCATYKTIYSSLAKLLIKGVIFFFNHSSPRLFSLLVLESGKEGGM